MLGLLISTKPPIGWVALMFMLARRLLLLSLIFAAFAFADGLQFSLSTTGFFSGGTPPDLAFAGIGTSTVPGFTGTTSGGALVLSSLGMFTLQKPTKGADVFHSDSFTLNIIFLAPTGVSGPNSFNATLQGTVNTQQGGVFIDFGPARAFTFSNPNGSGSFDLTLDDFTLDLPKNGPDSIGQALTGSIGNGIDPPPATVPEPLSMALLGTVIVLVNGSIRRSKAGSHSEPGRRQD